MALPSARRLAAPLAILLAAAGLAGCVTNRDVTGSIRPAAVQAAPSQAGLGEWEARYNRDPSDKAAALAYAGALRAADRTQQAVAVLEGTAIKHPYDQAVLSAYGKALADVGRLKEAAEVLPRAHTPDKPDWSVLNAQGSVADQMGDHDAAARYYEASLKIAPDSAATLSNLGLSYALDRRLPEAEATLRRAVALPGATARVRGNLAFVLALEGKDAEAEATARLDMSPEDAARTVASVKAMVAAGGGPAGIRPRAAAKRTAAAG